MRPLFPCLILVVACTALFGQSATFDVASVKRNPAGHGPGTRMKGSTGRIDYIGVPLKWLIRQAYRVQDSQIQGPDWLDTEGYDIAATYPPATPSRQQSEMWQALLAERFKLVVHHETKDLPAYWMQIANGGTKLRAVDAAPGGFQITQDGALRHLRSQTSAAGLAVILSDRLSMRVIDHTELKGTFDIAVDWSVTDEVQPPSAQPNLPPVLTVSTFLTAVETQLGLKLVMKKVATDIVIVDHAEKVPTGN